MLSEHLRSKFKRHGREDEVWGEPALAVVCTTAAILYKSTFGTSCEVLEKNHSLIFFKWGRAMCRKSENVRSCALESLSPQHPWQDSRSSSKENSSLSPFWKLWWTKSQINVNLKILNECANVICNVIMMLVIDLYCAYFSCDVEMKSICLRVLNSK